MGQIITGKNYRNNNDYRAFETIWADNKVEATRFASEYGYRFINSRVVEVKKVA